MKKLLLSAFWLLFGLSGAFAQYRTQSTNATFNAGNIIVNRIGDGNSSHATASGAPVVLEEYALSGGTATNTFSLPATFVQSGTASSEGQLNLSQDGKLVVLAGYNEAVSAGAVKTVPPRTVATVNNAQTVTTQNLTLASTYSGDNFRSAASKDGSAFWLTGGNGGTAWGTRYATSSATVSTPVCSTASSGAQNNTRVARIFNNTLYYSTGSGTQGIYTLGALPTNSGNTAVVLANTASSTSPYAFIFLDRVNSVPGPDVIYAIDDAAGILKYYYDASSSTWKFLNAVKTTTTAASLSGMTGITGYVGADSAANLFITSPTGLYKITDGAAFNANITATITNTALATCTTNAAYRSVSFSPGTGVFSAVSTIGNSATGFSTYAGTASATSSFTFSGSGQIGPVRVFSNSSDFEVSTSATTGFGRSISVSPVANAFTGQTIYVRVAAGATAGSKTSSISIYSANGTSPANDVSVTATVTAPTLAVSPSSLTGYAGVQGAASASKTFTLSGSSLASDITVDLGAGSNFEISTDDNTYGQLVTVSPSSGSISGTTVYVRVAATSGTGSISGTVTVSGANASNKTVSLSGSVAGATTSTGGVASITGLNARTGRVSAAQTFNVSGTGLSVPIVIKSSGSNSAYFEVSLNGTDYSSQVSVTPAADGSVASTAISVRQTAAAPQGSNTGNIKISSSPAADINISVSGTVSTPALTITPTTLTAFSGVYTFASTAQQVSLSGTGLVGNVTVASAGATPAAFEVSTDNITFSTSVSVTVDDATGILGATTVYVRSSAAAPIGTTAGSITFTSSSASTKTITTSTVVLGPTLSFSPTALNTFKSVSGAATASQSLTISAVRLSSSITMRIDAGYEYSTDNVTFTTTDLVIPASGTTASQQIYVRMRAGNTKGQLNKSLTFLTANATVGFGLYGQITQPFTSNSLVVLRVGSGDAALTSAGTAVFLDEYTLAGTKLQSIALPTSVYGKNRRLVLSGTATSEGLMTRSGDGKYLTLTGYDTTSGFAGVSSSASATINRTVAVVDYDGFVDVTTALSDFSTGNNARTAFTTNGTDIWVAGATGGIRYATKGTSGTSTLVCSTAAQTGGTTTSLVNYRSLGYAQIGTRGQLLVTSGSGSDIRLGAIGTGTPTTTGNTVTNLPGLPSSTTNPYQFLFVDQSAAVSGMDVLYITGDKSSPGPGGVYKYSLVGGTWVSNGSYDVNNSYRGISGFVKNAAGNVQLIASKDDGAGTTAVVVFTDTKGYNQTFTVTATATTIFTDNTTTTKDKVTSVVYAPVNENCGTATSVWKGTSGTAWDYAPNWCGGVPAATDTAVIPSGTAYSPEIATGTSVSVKTVIISGSLSIAGTGSLSISGNYLNNGTLTGGTGSTVAFSGTSAQVITGTGTNNFYNLTISNTSTGRVTNQANSTVQVQNTLSLPSGGHYTNNGSTILLSNSTGTARLGVLSNVGDYAGTLTVQRYLPASLIGSGQVGANVMVGSPVSGTTLGDFQTSTNQMFGFPGATGTGGRPNASSVYLYNPDSASAPYEGWVKPTSTSMAMNPGTGARVFFSGYFFRINPTYSLTGTLPTSLSYPITLKRCDAATCTTGNFPSGNGWNMIANPVPSEISWKSSAWTGKSNVSGTIYVWQQNNKRYSTFTAVTQDATNGGTDIIASGQAFFVKALTNGVLTATEAVKAGQTTPWTGIQRSAAAYRLLVKGTSPAGFSNEAIIGFSSDASVGYDPELDAQLLPGTAVNLATMPVGPEQLVVNRMPLPAASTELPVYFSTSENGIHTLSFTGITEMQAAGYTVSLRDNFAGLITELSTDAPYTFSVTADAASQGAGRFVLVFAPPSVTGVVAATKSAAFTLSPNPADGNQVTLNLSGFPEQTVSVTVLDALGKQAGQRTISLTYGYATEKLDMELPAGVYSVVCQSYCRKLVQKLVIR